MKSQHHRRTLVSFEPVEPRQFLHGVLAAGVLTVDGLPMVDDTIAVSEVVLSTGHFVRVTHATAPDTPGHPSDQLFPYAAVDSIVINGQSGDDSLQLQSTLAKPATIDGGDGNDLLAGGALADSLLGGSGNDHVSGRAGDDTLRGEAGSDFLFGHEGNDLLDGGAGNDNLQGHAGADLYAGGAGGDTAAFTDKIADLIITLDNVANDGQLAETDNVLMDVENVRGGGGRDRITGSFANNILQGNGNNDTLDGAGGNDLLAGGAGIDMADYSSRAMGVNVTLDNAPNDGTPAAEFDNVQPDVEQVAGGAGNDLLVGSASANTLIGNAGNDNIHGLDGDDLLVGGAGSDFLFGDGGNDELFAEDGLMDHVNGGAGFDTAHVDPFDVHVANETLL